MTGPGQLESGHWHQTLAKAASRPKATIPTDQMSNTRKSPLSRTDYVRCALYKTICCGRMFLQTITLHVILPFQRKLLFLFG